MLEQIPKIKNEFIENEPVFKSYCDKCGAEFKVFITPSSNEEDERVAQEELRKIKESKLCPNCRK